MTKKAKKEYSDDDDDFDPYYDQPFLQPPAHIEIISPALSENDRTLQVSANPSELTDSEVVNFFTQFGPIEEVTIPFDKTKNKWKGFLYIRFESAAIVNQLIKVPTKMINEKKALVAKKSTAGPNNLDWPPSLFATTPISSSNIMMSIPPPFIMPQYYLGSGPASPAGVAGPSGLGGNKMN